MNEQAIQSVLDGKINYAQCWEDFALLEKSLQIGTHSTTLSICSAGDNALALAIQGAKKVVCIDLSLPQLALAQLKLSAIEHLVVDDVYNLLGIHPAGRRVYVYHALRDKMPEWARQWWDHHEDVIREGVLHHGRFEKYLALFGQKILPLIHKKSTIERLAYMSNIEEQQDFYDKTWNNLRWKGLFRIFFSKFVMAKLGRSTEQFQYVDTPVAEQILSRTKRALTQIPVSGNPYLQWILLGKYPSIEHAHPYLQPQNIAKIKERLQNKSLEIEFVHSGLVEYLQGCPDNTFHAFNYSDIFEYLSEDTCLEIFQLSAQKGVHGARMAYWNLLAPRERPSSMSDIWVSQTELAERLYQQDRAFFYGRFVVEELHKR